MLMTLHRRHRELPLWVLRTGVSIYRVFGTSSLPRNCHAREFGYRFSVCKVLGSSCLAIAAIERAI